MFKPTRSSPCPTSRTLVPLLERAGYSPDWAWAVVMDALADCGAKGFVSLKVMARSRWENVFLEMVTCGPLTHTGPQFHTGPGQFTSSFSPRLWPGCTVENFWRDLSSSEVKWSRGRLGGVVRTEQAPPKLANSNRHHLLKPLGIS